MDESSDTKQASSTGAPQRDRVTSSAPTSARARMRSWKENDKLLINNDYQVKDSHNLKNIILMPKLLVLHVSKVIISIFKMLVLNKRLYTVRIRKLDGTK